MNVLQFEGVKIWLGDRLLLTVDTKVAPGKNLTVMGPSGSGKSTLLAFIGGFLDPIFHTEGAVLLNGQNLADVPAHARHTGILFQDALLFPHMSVGENLTFAIPKSTKGAARKELCEAALEQVGLDGFFERDPATLSGGQKARVALMRVLLSEPAALLLDEPFSKLDADRRHQMRELVFSTARERNLPTVLVTHDAADAEAAQGQLIELE